MTNTLNSIEELEIYKNTGLIEIAKYNSLFHGYWDLDRKSIIENFDNILKNNLTVHIPDIDLKFMKKKYVEDFDFFCNQKIKKKFKKDDPNYQNDRKAYLIQHTKNRYKNDEEFRKKMKENSKNYYQKLKDARKNLDEIKKMI